MLNEDGSAGHHETSNSIDISFRSVREQINRELSCVNMCLTPYIGLERARKVLAPYSIFIPATTYMEGDTGVRTFSVSQFHALTGQTNDGKIVTKTESPYNIYFDYNACAGSFHCRCKILTDDELETYLDNYERSAVNEEKEKKDHPLVARVKHAQIIDAWQSNWKTKDRSVDHDAIISKLKKKGLSVTHKDINSSIKHHQKKKKRLDELTAPTWDNTKRVTDRAIDRNFKYDDKARKYDRKSDRAHAIADIAKKIKLTGISSKFRKKALDHEATADKFDNKSSTATKTQIYTLGRQLKAMEFPGSKKYRPMKEETVDEGVVSKAKRLIRKYSGKQRKELHDKISRQMDDRQIKHFGRLVDMNRKSDRETLYGDKRYSSLNHRYMQTYEPGPLKIPANYMSKKGKAMSEEKTIEEKVQEYREFLEQQELNELTGLTKKNVAAVLKRADGRIAAAGKAKEKSFRKSDLVFGKNHGPSVTALHADDRARHDAKIQQGYRVRNMADKRLKSGALKEDFNGIVSHVVEALKRTKN